MMTNSEIAESVMGWKAVAHPTAGKPEFICYRDGSVWLPCAGSLEIRKWAPMTNPTDAMDVLKKCAEKMTHGIIGIASPMFAESVASTEKRRTQGWVVGKIGKPNNFDVEAPTLELAICKFAKAIFNQQPKGKT